MGGLDGVGVVLLGPTGGWESYEKHWEAHFCSRRLRTAGLTSVPCFRRAEHALEVRLWRKDQRTADVVGRGAR